MKPWVSSSPDTLGPTTSTFLNWMPGMSADSRVLMSLTTCTALWPGWGLKRSMAEFGAPKP